MFDLRTYKTKYVDGLQCNCIISGNKDRCFVNGDINKVLDKVGLEKLSKYYDFLKIEEYLNLPNTSEDISKIIDTPSDYGAFDKSELPTNTPYQNIYHTHTPDEVYDFFKREAKRLNKRIFLSFNFPLIDMIHIQKSNITLYYNDTIHDEDGTCCYFVTEFKSLKHCWGVIDSFVHVNWTHCIDVDGNVIFNPLNDRGER